MKSKQLMCLLLCLILILAGCSASSDEAMDHGYAVQETIAAEMGSAADSLTSSTTAASQTITDRKLIRTIRMDAETEHFDDLLSNLTAKISELGGYIESREVESLGYYSSRNTRYCSMTIRIPADALDRFVTHVNENANVTSTSETTEDVTVQYVDTEAKITALETEQARLLELLEAAQNLTEILEIEARLSDVTYELERYASQLRSYDNLVTYATVRLALREVTQLTPVEEPTVWQRISDGFSDTMEDLTEGVTDLFVWVVVNSPYLLILGVIAALCATIVHRKIKKRKAAQFPPESPQT